MATTAQDPVKDIQSQLDLAKEENPDYASAIDAARDATQTLAEGIELIEAGETYSGAAAVLEGLGGFVAAACLFAGPIGAIAGAVFSLITSIIGAILKALQPQKDSLEAQIEKLLLTEELKLAKHAVTSAEEDWNATPMRLIGNVATARKACADGTYDPKHPVGHMPDGYTSATLAAGISWDALVVETQWPTYTGKLTDAMTTLNDATLQGSPEWRALLDVTIGFMYRMLVSLHHAGGIVNEDGWVQLQDELKVRGDQFAAHLKAWEWPVQNNCPLYSRWHSVPGEDGDGFDRNPEPFYLREGVIEGTSFDEVGWRTSSFAVASSGTMFGCSTDGQPAAARRLDDWQETAGPGHGIAEVYIGELPDDGNRDVKHTVVACTSGKQLSICLFNDHAGFGEPAGTPTAWTPNEKRWGAWKTWTLDTLIGAVAIEPIGGQQYSILVLGMHDDASVSLFHLMWDGSEQAVEGFGFGSAEVKAAAGWHLWYADGDRWRDQPLSCAISVIPRAVQLGNAVKVTEADGTISTWNLRRTLVNDALRTHRGHFYSDGTFVMCSNLGLHMRCWDSKDKEYKMAHDPKVQTECVQKLPLLSARMYWTLRQKLTA